MSMGDHEAATPTPTQNLYPWKAFWRTAIQTGIPAFLGLLGILPIIIQDILDGFGRHLPPDMYAWLATAAVVITALSATLANIMARANVIAWTRKYLPFFAPDKTK
jgi:hypothetical protein